MTSMSNSIAAPTSRPFPYVTGQSRRVKAEPTKLSPLAVNVMAASGTLTTRSVRGAGLGRLIAILAVLVIVAALL